jgi:hypothetical protein
VPTVNLRSVRGIIGGLILLAALLGLIFLPREFFFPVLLAYVLFGVAKAAVLGVLERVPTGASIFDEEEEDPDAEEAIALPRHEEVVGGRRRRRRRRKTRAPLPTPTITPAVEEDGE